ncbi:porin [Paraburkholderia antibiotica]|uniref:Porin n=1 Tax=Paraburkholderia antibiotica TaxID=2728839 RepID=A0A7Y0FGS5_9BURK|nr:porin [Paraburkholderia antibiotica]NML35373.1 porin [Paraburkholderia antibiotica]
MTAVTVWLPPMAHAQSTVTLTESSIPTSTMYPMRVERRKVGLTSGVNNGSRFGLRGSEDLGSGLKVIFQLG